MTLSPVFRSRQAVDLLREHGVWERLGPAIEAQGRAVGTLYEDVRELIDEDYLLDPHLIAASGEVGSEEALDFLQEYFFLILFRSIFDSLGISPERLALYSELNFCIKGTITAADNIFDDQAKSLLPLKGGSGARFLSILQLMCFERLIRRSMGRGVRAGTMAEEQVHSVLRGLMNQMADIGRLEGSEEGGVDEIPAPDEMVERVHQVRGGALFALAFVAPRVLEEGSVLELMDRGEPAVARLGTAFQIVDDLTDFEFDLGRRSHNLLVSQIHHHGTAEEQAALKRFREGEAVPSGIVESLFRGSARAVLERAYLEARSSFQALEEIGFWFPSQLADEVVHAIVGLDGVARMEAITAGAE